MSASLTYKGYIGSIEYDDEDEIFHGKLEYLRDLVTYEGTTAKELKQAFQSAVDDYLELCADQNKTPDVPFKGSFNVRPGPDLHRRAILLARRQGSTLNGIVTEALQHYLTLPEHQER